MLLDIACVSKNFRTYSRCILASIYPQKIIYQARIAHEIYRNGSFFYYQNHLNIPAVEEDTTQVILDEDVTRDETYIAPRPRSCLLRLICCLSSRRKIHPDG